MLHCEVTIVAVLGSFDERNQAQLRRFKNDQKLRPGQIRTVPWTSNWDRYHEPSWKMFHEDRGKPMVKWVASIFGGAAILLGGLWFLQGTGLIVIEPIACVGECAALEGPSVAWTIAGAVTMLAGAAAFWFAWRRH